MGINTKKDWLINMTWLGKCAGVIVAIIIAYNHIISPFSNTVKETKTLITDLNQSIGRLQNSIEKLEEKYNVVNIELVSLHKHRIRYKKALVTLANALLEEHPDSKLAKIAKEMLLNIEEDVYEGKIRGHIKVPD